jgi:DNA-binding beta-propeller fold protein YncE
MASIIMALAVCLRGGGGALENPLGLTQSQDLRIGDIPLPNGAVELRRESRFPEKESKGPYLSQPEGFVLAPSGQIYVTDVINNEIYAFSPLGEHTLTFGRTGQGPGDLIKPTSIAFSRESIIVREVGNMRIQFFDFSGK